MREPSRRRGEALLQVLTSRSCLSGNTLAVVLDAPGRHGQVEPLHERHPSSATTDQRRTAGLPPERRAAFVAALALADPVGVVRLEVEGRCEGLITEAPRGTGGFGYDPVFLVPELDKATKGRVGHRGRAFAALEPEQRELLGAG